jgi:hypothetical protein
VETAAGNQPSRAAQAIQKIANWFVDPQQPSGAGRMVQRILDRFDDPAAALVPRYLGLRTREDTVFNTLGDFIFDVFQGSSDGLVISAELAARQQLFRTAAQRFASIRPGALPLFSDGFSLLIHRTKELTRPLEPDVPPDRQPDELDIEKLKALLHKLLKWAPFINVNSPTVTFRGNDLVAPRENETPTVPKVQDGWIAASEVGQP